MNKISKKLYTGIFAFSLGFFLLFGIFLGVAALLQNFVWYREQPGLGVQLIAILAILVSGAACDCSNDLHVRDPLENVELY